MTTGPVSAVLEQELAQEVRRQGIVVWLDRDASFTAFADRLVAQHATGAFPYPVVGFRGSFLSMLFALESRGSGYDKHPLLVHMPGFNEDGIRETPLLELYAAGSRFRKALDTLIRQAATGRALPAEVDRFLASKPTLELADDWLTGAMAPPAGALRDLLDAGGPVLLVTMLAEQESSLATRFVREEDAEVLREYVHKLAGMDEEWSRFAAGAGDRPAVEQILNALGAWLLCVEYVHDLRRHAHLAGLRRMKGLSSSLVKACLKIVVELRERYADAYVAIADEVASLIDEELAAMAPEDLGQIDTFREEDDSVLGGAVDALKSQRWPVALGWCKARSGDGSFWIRRDGVRRRAWELVGEAAAFGTLLSEHPRPMVGASDHVGALAAYAETGCKIDRAHRRFEQERALRLDPQIPHFGALQEVVGILRRLHRDWTDQLCRDFTRVCKAQGFLPPSELRQRNLYEQVVQPMALGGEKVAVFLVDAFRYEMATELLEELKGGAAGVALDLKARLAELPTITAVGMNALAPVVRQERLAVAGIFQGFRTGEYVVRSPADRCRAMGARTGGRPGLRMELSEICDQTELTLRAIKDHQIIVVHSTEIDDAGEANVGLHAFEATVRQLRAAWHHLQVAGVKQAVFTSDHGFLLQDETTLVRPFGKKTDPQRRFVLDPHARGEDGMIPVPLSSLAYDGISGFLLLREDTAVFATGNTGASFVHGGNSPQERIIPVLTVTRKRIDAASRGEYEVQGEAMPDAFGFSRLRVRIGFPLNTQTSLGFAGVRAIGLDLRVPGRPDIRAIVKEVSGAGSLKTGRIHAPVSEAWTEVFFALEGPSDERAPVEVRHADNIEKVTPALIDTLFSVTGVKGLVASSSTSGGLAWADSIEDPHIRGVFLHIDKHSSVTEEEIVTMLGSARAARKFALNFDAYLAKLPFRVRGEANASGKRYVREEEK